MENRSFRFDRHDRIMIDNVSYRSESKEKNTHFLQAIVDGFIDDFLTVKTDQDISLLMKSGRLRVDAGWFSKTLHLLRVARKIAWQRAQDRLATLLRCQRTELKAR